MACAPRGQRLPAGARAHTRRGASFPPKLVRGTPAPKLAVHGTLRHVPDELKPIKLHADGLDRAETNPRPRDHHARWCRTGADKDFM